MLGNPSADLDSFVSAVLYAYFCSHNAAPLGRPRQPKRLAVPLINLSSVKAEELGRLRPEFGVALGLATGLPFVEALEGLHKGGETDQTIMLREHLVTIADTRKPDVSKQAKALFPVHAEDVEEEWKFPLVLVDHNVLAVPAIEDLQRLPFEIVGCIDHHIDESFVPQTASPRIIRTGIGSCTSLVVTYLRNEGVWSGHDGSASGREKSELGGSQVSPRSEIAKLALSAILIDTANLTAEGKVSDVDRDAVSFLEQVIECYATPWDRSSFYSTITAAKEASLDHLTFHEIFDRDYKEWAESTKNGPRIRIGVSSVVKPLNWLQQKAKKSSSGSSTEGAAEMLQSTRRFAFKRETTPELDIFAIMTTSKSKSGEFTRELLVITSGQHAVADRALLYFAQECGSELKLQPWDGNETLRTVVAETSNKAGGEAQIWWQRNVAISRKGVAPMLRSCVKKVR